MPPSIAVWQEPTAGRGIYERHEKTSWIYIRPDMTPANDFLNQIAMH